MVPFYGDDVNAMTETAQDLLDAGEAVYQHLLAVPDEYALLLRWWRNAEPAVNGWRSAKARAAAWNRLDVH